MAQFSFASANAQINEPGIVAKLGEIKDVLQPANVGIDLDIAIPAGSWSSSSPYTYTYSNTKISTGCGIKVEFLDDTVDSTIGYLEYEKVAGGVRFTAPAAPVSDIKVRIHILNADAEGIEGISADEVSTDAISGAGNVQDALETLDTAITDVNTKVAGRAKFASINVSANSTMYFNHSGGVVLFSDRGGMWTEGSAGRTLAEIASASSFAVTRESNTKIKIVSSSAYSSTFFAIGNGDTFSFSAT